MQCLIIMLGILWTVPAWAETSIFHKISVLRFGHEQVTSIENGTVDLTSLGQNEFFHVQGNVHFIPHEWVDATYMDEAAFQQFLIAKQAISSPLRLKTKPYTLEGTDATYGTFVVRVHNDRSRRLALSFPRLFHPTEITYVDPEQQRRLIVHGSLNKDPARNRNFSELASTISVIDSKSDFYLFVKASSPLDKGRNTLNLTSFYVGEELYLNRLVYSTRFYASLISGTFLIIFIFYFFISSFRPQDHSSIYLCLYALCSFSLSLIYVVNLPLTNTQTLDVFTVLNLVSIAFLQCFLLDKLSFLWSRRTHWKMIATSLFIAVAGSLGMMFKLPMVVALFLVTSFLSSTVLIFATFYLGIKHRLSGISFFLIGAILNSSFQFPIMIHHILGSNNEQGFNIMMANFCMVLSLALVNAKEFAVTYRKSVEQSEALEEKNKEITFFNKNLEKLVDNKTREVRSLLDHIPQGVLSLAEDGLISKDYSAHLVQILGTENIGHQSFRNLVLDRCVMSSDQRDQTWQSILSIIGEEEFNFEANAGKLPLELVYREGAREKFLRATWNADVEEDVVVRLLVTLLDATAERELQKESDKQRQELILIQELLNLSPSKTAQFFSTSMPLLKENERIIRQERQLSASSIRMLFVNAHTVKGAARTLQLKDLARQVHDMEDYYAQILKHDEAINPQKLNDDIVATLAVMNRYIDINRNKLNRADDDSKVILEREFIENHYFFIKDLIENPPAVTNIIQWLREQNETLTRLIFEQLPASFDGYKERALKIAHDLGKAEPIFDFNIDDISIAPDQKTVLDNCMVHLLRNALDHGIENPAERKKNGKGEQGCIKVTTKVDAQFLTICIRDDGRGLAIKKLRAQGEAQGLLTPGSPLQDVANLIFASGISTAHEISQISGRGVGMSAVQTFMEKVDGTIQVRLGAPKDEAKEYYDFWFEIQFKRDHHTPLAEAC
jgi:hypothetical protein